MGKNKPIVHLITNKVTINDVVNSILAIGGSCICGDCKEEVEEITSMSDSLVINLGTPFESSLETILLAGRKALEKRIPIILDPVGIGISAMRKNMGKKLLEELEFTCIRGNYGEIKKLAEIVGIEDEQQRCRNLQASIDSTSESINESILLKLAKKFDSIIVATGEVDLVASKEKLVSLSGGSKLSKKVTGSGCILDGVIACKLAENRLNDCNLSDYQVVHRAVKSYKICAEQAEKYCQKERLTSLGIAENHIGTASFKLELMDSLVNFNKVFSQIQEGAYRYDLDMDKKSFNPAFYGIVGSDCIYEVDLDKAVEEAILGGVSLIQLREKLLSTREYIEKAKYVKAICDKHNVPLIINDRVDVCKAVVADGVHLGQADMEIQTARKLLGQDAIIGVTAHNLQEALKAEKEGADYIGVGAAFASKTKDDAVEISNIKLYEEISSHIEIPIIAIGGINEENIEQLANMGISGFAMISAIFEGNIAENSNRLREKINKLI